MKKKIFVTFTTAVLVLAGVTGCGTSQDDAESSQKNVDKDRIVAIQRCGKTVEYKGIPKKILATAPGVTDTLYDLGLGDKVVGVGSTAQGDPTEEYKELYAKAQKLGKNDFGTKEQVLSTGADFIYAEHSTWPFDGAKGHATLDDLKKANVQVYFSNQGCDHWGGPITGLLEDVNNLGKIFHKEDKAKAVVGKLQKRIDAAKKKVAGKKIKAAILGFDPGGVDMAAMGPRYTQGEMLETLGVKNVFSDVKGNEEYMMVNAEAVVDRNPDVVFIGASSKKMAEEKIKMARKVLANTTAGKNDQFYTLDDMGGQPGSTREITQLELIAEKIENAKH